MPEEEWKPVEFPKYEVSNLGRVRRSDNGLVVNFQTKPEGYKQLNITFGIHRLVAQAFLPNPENKPTVDHIKQVDPNQCDNSVSNLRWATWDEQRLNKRMLHIPISGHHHIHYNASKKKNTAYVIKNQVGLLEGNNHLQP